MSSLLDYYWYLLGNSSPSTVLHVYRFPANESLTRVCIDLFWQNPVLTMHPAVEISCSWLSAQLVVFTCTVPYP
jgi:hypothetical protein